jgi:membrane protease YdiL (CAAX protease family)
MEIDPRQLVLPAAVAFLASATVLAVVVIRLLGRRPVVPYQRRRRVPWRWPVLLLVLVVSLAFGQGVRSLADAWFGAPNWNVEPSAEAQEMEGAHPLVVLLQVDRRPGVLLLVCLSALVAAPIAEEFYFRLMLQGWLEAEESRLRRRNWLLRGLTPGALPVLTTSLLFGSIHFRLGPPPTDPELLVYLFATNLVARVLTFGFAVWLLRSWSGATACDLGFVPDKLLPDVGLGLLTFAAIAAPLYTLQLLLGAAMPQSPFVDPITLTLFALVLGALYCRTHRIVPSIVLHMALNATSVAMALWLFDAP